MTTITTARDPAKMKQARIANGHSRLAGIHKVLVPLDFSTCSLKSIQYAVALVEQFGVDLHLVHAFDFDYPPSMLAGMPIVMPEKDLARHAKSRLTEIAAQYVPRVSRGNLHVVQGRAYHAICELAKKLKVDLIVTSTHGRTGLRHLVMGSTAEHIVRHAPCPVLVVRDQEWKLVNKTTSEGSNLTWKPEKVLVPLDFSDCSIAGLEFALRFASPWRSKLTLFHCVPAANLVSFDEFGRRPMMDLNAYILQTAKAEMRELDASLLARDIDATEVIDFGSPAHQVCDYAGTHEIDLIVTSTHGSTGFTHAFLGSTAEHIVRYASCPVLVVRSQQDRFRK